MVALTDPEKAVLRAFLKSKRGSRKLIESTVDALIAYFAPKGTPLLELPTTPPAGAAELGAFETGWLDYAASAGIILKAAAAAAVDAGTCAVPTSYFSGCAIPQCN